MTSIRLTIVCLVAAWLVPARPAVAQATAPATRPGDLTGNWIWIQRGTFGTSGRSAIRNPPANIPPNSRAVLLVLTQNGEKLTGHLINYGPNRPEIQEASFKDGQITFQIIQTLNPQTAARIGRPEREVLSTYKGKLEGDTIRGTIWRGVEGTGGGEPWEASRLPAE